MVAGGTQVKANRGAAAQARMTTRNLQRTSYKESKHSVVSACLGRGPTRSTDRSFDFNDIFSRGSPCSDRSGIAEVTLELALTESAKVVSLLTESELFQSLAGKRMDSWAQIHQNGLSSGHCCPPALLGNTSAGYMEKQVLIREKNKEYEM